MGAFVTSVDTNATTEITGSGTANNVAMFTSAQEVGNAGLAITSSRLAASTVIGTEVFYVTLSAGAAAAGSAPLVFTTGTSLTTAVAGAMEYTTDDLFFTISTGTARKRLLMADPAAGLSSLLIPVGTTNGRLTDSGVRYTSGRLADNGGTSNNTLYLTLSAGAAAAGNAPLVFASGTNLTTAIAGAMEYNGTNLFFSPSTTRFTVAMTSGVTYAVGDLLSASTTTVLSRIADVAAGSYLRSGGVGVLPLWSTATLPNTAVTGDLLYASATSVYSNLADVAVGSYLRSGGVTTAPLWSTLILPNAATANQVVYASATDTYGGSTNLVFNGTNLGVGTATSTLRLNLGGGIAFITDIAYPGATVRGIWHQADVGFIIQGNGTAADVLLANNAGSTALIVDKNAGIGIGPSLVVTALLHLSAGTATASTAPLKFTTGTSLTTAEAGAMEFTTDDLFFTITTGAARKNITLWDTLGTSTRVPYATTNGRLTDSANMTYSGTRLSPNFITLAAGAAAAGNAPLVFTTGTSLTTAIAGAMEFTTDDLFFTITTGTARKRLLMADAVGGLTSGRVPFATTNGRLTDTADMTFSGIDGRLTVTQIGATTFAGNITMSARLLGAQGTDVASGTNLTLSANGNTSEITGTTQIDLIVNTTWQNGSVVTLVFNESVTVRHGIATSGANITILLAGAANFAATANDTLTLVLSETTAGGQAWREVARAAI